MTGLTFWWAQVQAAPPWPAMSTVVTGFATLAALYLIKIVLQIRDVVFGDGKDTGLVAQLTALAKTLSAHCVDERDFWDRVEKGHRHLVDETQAAVSVSEVRLSERMEGLAERIKALGGYLDLAQRKGTRRKGNT